MFYFYNIISGRVRFRQLQIEISPAVNYERPLSEYLFNVKFLTLILILLNIYHQEYCEIKIESMLYEYIVHRY